MSLNPFNRKAETTTGSLFDEAFLRRMERLAYRTAPTLRGGMMGERRSRNLRPAQDFNDHRPYAFGDDLRHVDWYAYARHSELFVKLGEDTQRLDLHILLDASPSMGWTPGVHYGLSADASSDQAPTQKWNMARRLVGALGYLGLAGGERLILTPYAGVLGPSFGPTQGKRQVPATLKYLSDLRPMFEPGTEAPGVGLAASLTEYARTHPRGGILLLISDLLDTVTEEGEDASAYLAEGLRQLANPRWQVLVMHVLTTYEFQPTLQGDYDLEDIETKERLPMRLNQATRAQYRLRVRRWCANLQHACAQRGATYGRILAEWPLEQKVVPYLRQRGLFQ